jgi:hypothetical protein
MQPNLPLLLCFLRCSAYHAPNCHCGMPLAVPLWEVVPGASSGSCVPLSLAVDAAGYATGAVCCVARASHTQAVSLAP